MLTKVQEERLKELLSLRVRVFEHQDKTDMIFYWDGIENYNGTTFTNSLNRTLIKTYQLKNRPFLIGIVLTKEKTIEKFMKVEVRTMKALVKKGYLVKSPIRGEDTYHLTKKAQQEYGKQVSLWYTK